MKGSMVLLVVFLLVLVGINVGFGLLERILAKKANRAVGLVMPVFFFIVAVMSMVSSIEKTFMQLISTDTPLAAGLLIVIVFLILNIPTIVTYTVYFFTRKKMGEAPWPMKQKQ